MRAFQLLTGVGAITAAILLIRIVVHGYTEHGHLDLFHFAVALAAAVGGGLLLLTSLRTRPTSG